MRIGIVQFPGSNCERETILAVKRAGMKAVEFLWNQNLEDLKQFDGYILVGGFSYEDRSRSGIIAALDPLMAVIKEQSQRGKPVLGICNGAQILVESGLVPGLENYQLGAALTDNKRLHQGQVMGTGFYNTWVQMRLNDQSSKGAFTRHLNPQNILRLPIAHGEGRFIIPSELLQEMQKAGLTLFHYCDAEGKLSDDFPLNPNGSVNSLAAISNKRGNVLAMMPHPERTPEGDALFQSMRDYIADANYAEHQHLSYQAPPQEIQTYQPKASQRELIVELIITDNQMMSVNSALKRAGLGLELKRQTHWEIECDSDLTYEKILRSGVLFNNRKEFSISAANSRPADTQSLLIRAKDDVLALQKKQLLENHFGLQGIQSLSHSVLWQIPAKHAQDREMRNIIDSHLLFNPYAHDCYYY